MQEKEYLVILIQSLRKKLALLNQISDLNQEQGEILQNDDAEPDAFDANVRDKDELIRQIVTLDAGFNEVYAHIGDLMERNPSAHEVQLEQMRELVREIMAKDASVRADEQRNYKLAQQKFAGVKKQAREVRASQKMVNDYYRSMMGKGSHEPTMK